MSVGDRNLFVALFLDAVTSVKQRIATGSMAREAASKTTHHCVGAHVLPLSGEDPHL
jgi:hypothetical protein